LIVEDCGSERAAEVDVEANPIPVAVRLRKTCQPLAHATHQHAAILDGLQGLRTGGVACADGDHCNYECPDETTHRISPRQSDSRLNSPPRWRCERYPLGKIPSIN
jgi:hypothetical protein